MGHKSSKLNFYLSALLFLALFVGMAMPMQSVRAAGPWFVATIGNDGNDCLSLLTACLTINGAIGKATAGDTINVAAGTYAAGVAINKSITLKGAQFGVNVSGRTAAGVSEISTIQGLIAVTASNIIVDGFTLTNWGQTYALTVGSSSSNVTLTYNIIDTVGAVGLASNVHAILLSMGPDFVTIAHNRFNNIKAGTKSVSAIGVVDSTSLNSSTDLLIQDNIFTNIASVTKGAYGIIINNKTGAPGAQIKDNTFSGLSGGWTHAIGLEGPTPSAIVTGNIFSGLTALGADNTAIFFEANPVGNTVTIDNNQFNGSGYYGVLVHPNDVIAYNYIVTTGTGNVWGAGVLIAPNVVFATTTTITVDTPDPSLISQNVSVTVIVAAPASGAPTPTGTVTISGGVANCPITLVAGTGSCIITFSVSGANTITATYPITGNFSASSDTEAHVVTPTFTVTFNANGGTGAMVSQTASVATNLTSNTFTKVGYTFTGWNTAANGSGTAYANNASYPFTASVTLYAQWSIDVIATPIFSDVPFSHWASGYIERLYRYGVTSGCGTNPLIYCPDGKATRAEMAIFILRAKYNTPFVSYTPPAVGTSTGFADVPVGAFADAWIKQLAVEGITVGCGGGNYCPNANITRAEMAIFLLRGKYGSAYNPPVATGTVFSDVPLTSFASAWIEQLAKEGITSGCGAGKFCPSSPVTRAEMAVFLVKAFGLP